MMARVIEFAGIVLLGCVIAGPVNRSCAQDTQRQNQQQNSQQPQYRDEAQNSSQGQEQQNLRSFRGKVSQKENDFFFEELLHHTPYRLTDTWNVKRFVGKTVRVTGWLDQDQKTIHVKSISLVP
jgi:outer membrane PBP1 activator LpoA protein